MRVTVDIPDYIDIDAALEWLTARVTSRPHHLGLAARKVLQRVRDAAAEERARRESSQQSSSGAAVTRTTME